MAKYAIEPYGVPLLQHRAHNTSAFTSMHLQAVSLARIPVVPDRDAFYFSFIIQGDWFGETKDGSLVTWKQETCRLTQFPEAFRLILPPGNYEAALLRISKAELLQLAAQFRKVRWLMDYAGTGFLEQQEYTGITITPFMTSLYVKLRHCMSTEVVDETGLEHYRDKLLVIYASALYNSLHPPKPFRQGDSFSNALTNAIEANLYVNHHLETIADTLCMGISALKEHCRKEMGMSAGEYISNYCLQLAAKKLIECPEADIKIIAWEIGFTSHSHFTDKFGRHFGCSPSEYRSKNRKQ